MACHICGSQRHKMRDCPSAGRYEQNCRRGVKKGDPHTPISPTWIAQGNPLGEGLFTNPIPSRREVDKCYTCGSPASTLCDTLLASDNLARISAQEELILEEEKLIQKEKDRLKNIKHKLEKTIREPRAKKDTYTLLELKQLAVERNVDVKGLKTKASLAQKILNSF